MKHRNRGCFGRGLTRGLLLFILEVLGGPTCSRADDGWEGRIFSVLWENDVTAHTDRHYTQGARLVYLSADDAFSDWLQRFSRELPAIGLDVEARKFGFGAGQEIYTPENLHLASGITNDRPYAGWLFANATLQRRGEVSSAWQALENLRLDLGVIGPESLAREAQYIAHSSKPRG